MGRTRRAVALLGGFTLVGGVGGKLISDSTDWSELSNWDAERAEEVAAEEANLHRRVFERPALDWNDDLAAVAKDHAQVMAEREELSHESPDGTEPKERVEDVAGCYTGENVARTLYNATVETPDGGERYIGKPEDVGVSVVNVWMHSPSHRDNLLAAIHSEQGIGMARADSGDIYVVQNFC